MKRRLILVAAVSITYITTVLLAWTSVRFESKQVVHAQGTQECVSVETTTSSCGFPCGFYEYCDVFWADVFGK